MLVITSLVWIHNKGRFPVNTFYTANTQRACTNPILNLFHSIFYCCQVESEVSSLHVTKLSLHRRDFCFQVTDALV